MHLQTFRQQHKSFRYADYNFAVAGQSPVVVKHQISKRQALASWNLNFKHVAELLLSVHETRRHWVRGKLEHDMKEHDMKEHDTRGHDTRDHDNLCLLHRR